MSAFVVDASVAIKWLLPESDADIARRLLRMPHLWFAPDLLFAEMANIIWKRVRRREFSADEGQRMINAIVQSAVEEISSRELATEALEIAAATGRSAYDSLYLAMALRLDTRLITADERLDHAISVFPQLSAHIELLTAFAP
jgi:predicted nucleic acid-binding protein